jgi:hypothetical protein
LQIGDYQPDTSYFAVNTLSVTLFGNTRVSDMESSCPDVCLECLYMLGTQRFMYIPGDLLIPGIFDVHYSGESPFSCGPMRVFNGFQYTEAFAFALGMINDGKAPVQLNDVRLGGAAFDGCSNAIRASTIVSAIHSGALHFSDNPAFSAMVSNIQGWLSYDSESTVGLATILKHFGIPAVSPGATTPMLNDKTKYDTFFRTIPSDSLIVQGMAKLTKELGFSYVITVNAPNMGSRDDVEEFRKYAEEQGICIGASYEFVTDGDEEQIIRYITQSSTRVVIVFADPEQNVLEMLDAKNEMLGAGNIIFIANRPWMKAIRSAPGSMSTRTRSAANSITFRLNSPTVAEFVEYFREQRPTIASRHRNPWFNEYYQAYLGCNLPGNWENSVECNDPLNRGGIDSFFQEDMWVLSTVNAVYGVAAGVHRTLEELCPGGAAYRGVCPEFVSSTDTYARIMAHMDASEFLDLSGDMFRFIDREANKGFLIESIDGTQENTVSIVDAENISLLSQNYQDRPTLFFCSSLS